MTREMKGGPAKILIIDDHAAMRDGLEINLRPKGHQTFTAASGEEGMACIDELGGDVSLVITDIRMAPMDGMEVLRRVRKEYPDIDVLVMTAHGSVDLAVEAMKEGARDFVTKPFNAPEFATRVGRVLSEREARLRLKKENARLWVENAWLRDDGPAKYGRIVGRSPGITAVKRFIDRVARTDSTVMVYGESGTGKELVARAIHAASHRREEPFVSVNCGALPEGLLDSELFGHEAGSFTGAEQARRGRFELAEKGTLLLDEISTMAPQTQVRLLRVLQERELERVGGEKTISVDVRIIAASNQSAPELNERADFRSDLYYRLHVVPITLPPLRDRREDIPDIARHFLRKLQGRTRSHVLEIAAPAMEKLVAYQWPGNVRELENVIERALVLAEGPELEPDNIVLHDSGSLSADDPDEAPLDLDVGPKGIDFAETLLRVETKLIKQALRRTGGVKSEAARLLGMRAGNLSYRIEKYGIK